VADNKPQGTIKKKVSPYPFEGSLEVEGKRFTIHVRRLTLKGIIADVGANVVKVGDEYKAVFALPVLKSVIVAQVKIMKIFDQFRDQTIKGGIDHMAECRFLAIGENSKECISKFLTAIKQA
jgi:hypothetical protein